MRKASWLLRAKPHHLFLTYLVSAMAVSVIADWVARVFEWPWDSIPFRAMEMVLVATIYFAYPLTVGRRLSELLAGASYPTPMYLKLFFSVALVTLNGTAIMLLQDSPFVFVLVGVHVVIWLSLIAGPARVLVWVELNRKPDLSEYTTTVFQFMIWPVGVWWIQPRVHDVLTKFESRGHPQRN